MGLFFSNIYLGSLSIFCVPDAVQPLQLVSEPRVIPMVFILDGNMSNYPVLLIVPEASSRLFGDRQLLQYLGLYY